MRVGRAIALGVFVICAARHTLRARPRAYEARLQRVFVLDDAMGAPASRANGPLATIRGRHAWFR